jgi:hypothetical protein
LAPQKHLYDNNGTAGERNLPVGVAQIRRRHLAIKYDVKLRSIGEGLEILVSCKKGGRFRVEASLSDQRFAEAPFAAIGQYFRPQQAGALPVEASSGAAPDFVRPGSKHPAELCYGVTEMTTGRLMTLPTAAVMLTLPLVVLPVTIVTVPAETVAKLVLLDVQVATGVTSTMPLHVVACAVKVSVGAFVVKGGPLVGCILMDWIHPTVTFTVCVPVIDGF